MPQETTRLKILIVNRMLGVMFGGGESFDFNAARYLQKNGHEVTLITGCSLTGKRYLHYERLNTVYIPCPNLQHYAHLTEKLNNKLSAAFYHLDKAIFERAVYRWCVQQGKGAFDIVQCCSLFGLSVRLLERFKQPVIAWLPGPPSGLERKFLCRLIQKPRFGLFTHGSPEWTLNDMGFVRNRDFTIIEPGVELSKIDAIRAGSANMRGELGLSQNSLLGITTARLVPIKNHRLLLESISLAKQRGVLWHWLIIGEGLLEQKLRNQARRFGIDSHIHFLGYQQQSEVHKWLATANLFALTSTYENFSIATLEAMAHQLPVIGTRVGYLQHLIENTQAGMVVACNNKEQLADALMKMADPMVRQQYTKHGRAFVDRLDWPLIAERLERLYEKVIEGIAV